LCAKGEKAYLEEMGTKPMGIERIVPGDFVAFASIWNSMTMVKLALEARGIYVNNKPTAVKRFIEEYKDIEDVAVVVDLQELWVSWHHSKPDFDDAVVFTNRLLKVARQIDRKL
jgi:hypothetical protein